MSNIKQRDLVEKCDKCGRDVKTTENLWWDEETGGSICDPCSGDDNLLNDHTRVGNLRKCACGCRIFTNSPKSTYLPGHDARHAGIVGRLLNETGDHNVLNMLPSDALKAKARGIAASARAKESSKLTRARKAVKVDYTQHAPVKVGRWTYPARVDSEGTVQRNIKRDGSGEWVAYEGKDA